MSLQNNNEMIYFNKSSFYISLLFLTMVSIWLFSGSTAVSDHFIKGMTVSCQTWGYEWATPEMRETMIELKNLGANSISIHPYARIYEMDIFDLEKIANLVISRPR